MRARAPHCSPIARWDRQIRSASQRGLLAPLEFPLQAVTRGRSVSRCLCVAAVDRQGENIR